MTVGFDIANAFNPESSAPLVLHTLQHRMPSGMRDRYSVYQEPREQTLHVARDAIREIEEDSDGITVRFSA